MKTIFKIGDIVNDGEYDFEINHIDIGKDEWGHIRIFYSGNPDCYAVCEAEEYELVESTKSRKRLMPIAFDFSKDIGKIADAYYTDNDINYKFQDSITLSELIDQFMKDISYPVTLDLDKESAKSRDKMVTILHEQIEKLNSMTIRN